jgi:hypothetical protein
MKQIIFCVILSIFFLSSCNEKVEINYPVLIASKHDSLIQVNTKEMQLSSPIVYGVNIKDSLNFSLSKNYKSENYTQFKPDSLQSKSDSLILIVDSKNKNFHSDELHFFSLKPVPLSPEFLDSLKQHHRNQYEKVTDTAAFRKKALKRKYTHYRTLPVFLYNSSSKNKVISNSALAGDLLMVVEAKDKKGNWRPIEYNYVPGRICSGGIRDYVLKPKHFIVSTIKKYMGHYKTKLRVKLLTYNQLIYSNEFNGVINYSQFNHPEQVKMMNKRYSDSTNSSDMYKRKLIFLNY